MLTNIPTEAELNETALRLYFNAWSRSLKIIQNFQQMWPSEYLPWQNTSKFTTEWEVYVDSIQPELGAIAATIQQSAEIRLKSIICETSPYILLLKSEIKLKNTDIDIDFTDQKTIDAIDMPAAVCTFTPFSLPDDFIYKYQRLRRLRNKIIHTGKFDESLKPQNIIQILCEQYVVLWPDGKWLSRRVRYDADNISAFFYGFDDKWSSLHSDIMLELPTTIELFDNRLFKNCFGVKKSQLKGHCPNCRTNLPSGGDLFIEPTVEKTGATSAKCYMCECNLVLKSTKSECECDEDLLSVSANEVCCYFCGEK